MTNARRLWRSIGLLSLLAVSTTLLLPAFTGHPTVTYASSGSMEPTIGVFDVFFVNPFPSRLAVGDIIVYRSISHGGPAVHRIVGGDEQGWLTQGDANPAPDQNGAEPLVTADRILGKVLVDSDGSPIIVADVGITYVEGNAQLVRAQQAVGGPRQLMALMFLATALVSGTIAIATGRRKERARPMRPRAQRLLRRWLPRGILGKHVGLGLLLVLSLVTVWSATHARSDVSLDMVVVQDASAADTTRAQAPGGSLPREIQVRSLGLLPTLAFMEGKTPDIAAPEGPIRISPNQAANVAIVQTAGAKTGLQSGTVDVWRYPALLPAPLIASMHDIAPTLPFYVLYGFAAAIGAVWFSLLRITSVPVGRMLGIQEPWL